MAEKHNPKDINKKLRKLTPEQGKALAADLNANYNKKPAKKPTQKKSGK